MVWASQLYVVPNIQEFISTSEIFGKICHRDIEKCDNVVFVTGDISDVVAGKTLQQNYQDYEILKNS